jgi:hypothetical protein
MKSQARNIAGQMRTAVESYINNVSPETREDLIHHCEAFMSLIYRQAYPQGGQQLCFHNRRKMPQSSGEHLKSMVESVETERIGAEGASPYEAKANYLYVTHML